MAPPPKGFRRISAVTLEPPGILQPLHPTCGALLRDPTGEVSQAYKSYLFSIYFCSTSQSKYLEHVYSALTVCGQSLRFGVTTSSDMTRRLVYAGALIAFLAGKCLLSSCDAKKLFTELWTASALTLASIIIPRWISWDSETVMPSYLSLPLTGLLLTSSRYSPAAKRFTIPTVFTNAVPLLPAPAKSSLTKRTAMATVISAPCGAPSVFSYRSRSS